eukprot:gene17467-20842_t
MNDQKIYAQQQQANNQPNIRAVRPNEDIKEFQPKRKPNNNNSANTQSPITPNFSQHQQAQAFNTSSPQYVQKHNTPQTPIDLSPTSSAAAAAAAAATFASNSARSQLLEDFRAQKMKLELTDIKGHIAEFSKDQVGSRIIQQKIENAGLDDKQLVFDEVIVAVHSLMTDVFGNYVLQKFFEHGTSDQKRLLADKLKGHILPLALQMYGCRVIQKAIESIELDQQIVLITELDGHIVQCVTDQNGNHVIQKCIEKIPTALIQFIIDSFNGHIYHLATHPYGCRVIQRILEHCDDMQVTPILDELMRCAVSLVQDQYGNYVIQHVLEHGTQGDKSAIVQKLQGQIYQLSQHKFASNVIEKCVQYGSINERAIIINEILGDQTTQGSTVMLKVLKDPYANYVIQKILDIVDNNQREMIIQRITPYIPTLRKVTYDFCKRINNFTLPEYIIQGVFTLWFLVTLRLVLFAVNAPVLYYHVTKYLDRSYKADPTKVYTVTQKMGNHMMLKLVFYMVMFFIYLFIMLFNLFSE